MGIEAGEDDDGAPTGEVVDPGPPWRTVVRDVVEVVGFTARREEEDDRDGSGCNGRAASVRVGGLEQHVAASALAMLGDDNAVVGVVHAAGTGRRLRGWGRRRGGWGGLLRPTGQGGEKCEEAREQEQDTGRSGHA